MVPNPLDLPEGCSFHPRCKFAEPICRRVEPELIALGARRVRCLMYDPAHQAAFRADPFGSSPDIEKEAGRQKR